MAIYQFYIAVIPKQGLLEYFGNIPIRLIYDPERVNKFDSGREAEDEFEFFEFIQHKCWSLAKIKPDEIVNIIDSILDRENWGNDEDSHNWKTETKDLDLDASIATIDNNEQIEQFTFRIDLGQPQLKFLQQMITLANDNEFLLMDIKGNIVKPNIEEISELIKISNAHRFMDDPAQFFDDIANKRIELE